VRAEVVTAALQRFYNDSAQPNAPPFEYDKKLAMVQGQLIANDLSQLITRRAVFKMMGKPNGEDQMAFSKGASKYLDEMFIGAYRGRAGADGKPLRGVALRDAMSDELLEPLSTTLRDDFIKAYPGADAKQALLHAENLSLEIVDNYYKQIDYANTVLANEAISTPEVNSGLDYWAMLKSALTAPAQAYGGGASQATTATGTSSPQ
jgi:hypothetical protein